MLLDKISQVLIQLRLEIGYKTSKGFFNYLKDRGLDCNYQYFVKIEKGLVFPSSVLVNQVAKALDKNFGEKLIHAYCAQQFTDFDYLFEKNSIPMAKKDLIKGSESLIEQGQKELNQAQIDTLKKRKENYFLFLILTLSRSPVTIKDLKMYPALSKSIKDLLASSIALEENDALISRSSEFRFPKASDDAAKKTYALFDEWDLFFSHQFHFEEYLNKMMIRRISPRYFGVIQKQIESFVDFVRCSDEFDQRHNTEVLHLSIKVSKGQLPG